MNNLKELYLSQFDPDSFQNYPLEKLMETEDAFIFDSILSELPDTAGQQRTPW